MLPLQPVRYGESLQLDQIEKTGKSQTPGTGFGEVLQKSIDGVNAQMREADELSRGLTAGEHGNIHETMIAMEKAGVSFRLMTKVQQKAIQAYQEMMRMQL
ncbi:MAG: flagellar hook-basal body complex protein FliE [Desulfobulbaceae bacterium DB1]|nr:MAG: flagellar hook-basal body complex protein FliE [Desulfobulbaceae bacterium DB1]